MKIGWETKTLSELYQVGSSKRVLKSEWKMSGVPFYRGREVTRLAADGFVENELFISEEHFAELSSEYGVPKAGDIVITAIGTIGNSHVVRNSDRFYFKDASVLWMKRTADVSSEFVNLWLKSPAFFGQLDRGNGATVDTLTIEKLKSVEINVPSQAEQERIVNILNEAFEGIATAKANAEKNLRNARALFESHLQSVFTQPRQQRIERRLGDVVTRLTNGYVGPTRNIYHDSGVPYLLARHVKNNRLLFDEKTFITDEFNRKNKKSMLKAGDVLLVQSGHIGHSAVVTEEHEGHNCHAMIVITPVEGAFIGSFLSLFFNSSGMKQKFQEIRSGSTVPHLTCGEVRELTVPLPDLATQKRLVARSLELESETQRLANLYERKLAALEALKKSLLHMAFNGQI